MKDTNPDRSAARLWGGAERRCGPLKCEVKKVTIRPGMYTSGQMLSVEYKKFSTSFVSPLCANESLIYTL